MGDIKVVPRKGKVPDNIKKTIREPDWSQKRLMSVIRASLRSIWSRLPVRLRVLDAAQRGDKYLCGMCNELHDVVEVDHIVSAGTLMSLDDLPEFARKLLLAEEKDLRTLCKPCHIKRTQKENEERRQALKKGV